MSGHLSASGAGDGDWDRLEEIEARRCERHAEIIQRVFGAEEHRTADLAVKIVREPMNRSEKICFYVP